jgi:hypothetical protein
VELVVLPEARAELQLQVGMDILAQAILAMLVQVAR